jgi:cobalt/nickel transport system permease protein
MHIPDGFLDAKTVVLTGALAAGGVATALRRARVELPPRRVPLLGLTAAFVFAAQMVNFPVAGGTSGHLLGATLAAVLLGPSGAVLVMTAVLTVQCLIFADGGLLALGANVFNMGVVSGVAGHYIYRSVSRLAGGGRGRLVAVAVAAWAATVLAAIVVAGELAFSGVVPWGVAALAMGAVHALIGVGEALITALVVLAVQRTRPELLAPAGRGGPGRAGTDPPSGLAGSGGDGERIGVGREALAYGLLVSAGIAVFVAPWASPWPDGLERVAGRLGFSGRALEPPLTPSPVPDYAVPGIASDGLATALAGLLGIAVVFLLAFGAARLVAARRR